MWCWALVGGCRFRAAFGVFWWGIGGGYTRLVLCGCEILGVGIACGVGFE